jgi:multiple sugar transport system ATP-binding protein
MTMGDRVCVLRKGTLQQEGPPQELYDEPGNLFVASFIGSPAMNVLEATLERNGDGLVARVGSSLLPLAGADAGLAGYTGKRIALGIRPEALGEADGRSNGHHGRLPGVVRAVEALGPEQLAHVEVEATPVLAEDVLEGLVDAEEAHDLAEIRTEGDDARALVVARLDASTTVRPDERVELAVDLRKLHFFDLDSGSAIGA